MLGFFVVRPAPLEATTVPEARKLWSHRRHKRAFIGVGIETLGLLERRDG
jgi:hypothetical protein